MTNLSTLRSLLATAQTAEALEQLSAWAQHQSPVWRQAALLLQASWANNEQEANRGLIAYGEAERVRNRVTAGALGLIDEIESGASAPKSVLEGLQKEFLNEQVAAVLQNGNMTNLSGSNIHVQGSKDVVIGSGNVINKKTGLGRRQFWAMLAGLALVLVAGYFAFDYMRDRQEDTYVSLQEILSELKMRSEQDPAVYSRVENNRVSLERWLSAGMNALQKKEYPTAVENLEKVAAEAPLATVRQNLAFAYDKMGKTDKAKDNREQAQEIRERKPPVANVAASNTEQPTPAAEVPKTVPKKDTVRSVTASSGVRMNLIAMENGGKYVSGSNPGLERLINGSEKRVFFLDNDEMVISFKDEGLATFNEFELFVNENSGHNIQAFELSAGNAPDGNFKLIGKFTPENLVLNQKFSFPPVTARYVKFKMLKSVGGSGYYPAASEIRLMGQLK